MMAPAPGHPRVMGWVMCSLVAWTRQGHCWGGFMIRGEERTPSQLTFLARRMEFQIGKFGTI